ncbi:MAG: hypothetical protein INQ03_14890 [Candidatus Heimdallarchaeota archaeon]|nr:hypothetical protein [Candidatus Heimdallarchaeota archaeon]
MTSVLLVGHVSEDLRFGKRIPGGPPQYQIPILKAMGYNVHLITSCREDHPILNTEGITIHNIASEDTTTYAFSVREQKEIGKDDRILKLIKRASQLDQLRFHISEQYDFAIVSPIAGELSRETMEYITQCATVSFLDLQGLARRFTPTGEVYEMLSLEDFNWAIDRFSVVKASSSELPDEPWKVTTSSILVVTNSGWAIHLYHQGNVRKFKLTHETEVIDDTGSGDIFLSSLVALFDKYPLEDAIIKAHEITRLHLAILGCPSVEQSKQLIENVISTQ